MRLWTVLLVISLALELSVSQAIETPSVFKAQKTCRRPSAMPAVFDGEYQFHEGELEVQRLLKVNINGNPTTPYMPQRVADFLSTCPLMILGTLSPDGSPWVSVFGGQPGYAMSVGEGKMAMKIDVPACDPLAIDFKSWEGQESEENGKGEGMVAGLGMDLETRRRIKFAGKAERNWRRVQESGEKSSVGFIVDVQETMGNCPKYITTRKLASVEPKPIVHPTPLPLPKEALDVIAKSDVIFVASRHNYDTMDANHRGGPPGFVRVISNEDGEGGTAIVWPEYSGNRLYQTLGNFKTTPVAGVTIPDFSTGDVLYLTGKVDILVGKDADNTLPRSNLAVKLTVLQARFVQNGLTARGDAIDYSPYNPPVRYLMTEKVDNIKAASGSQSLGNAKLTAVDKYQKDSAKFTFKMDESVSWKAGQYVALSFYEELSTGYHHMRDDDPASLNDDYIRTFTVSSAPPASGKTDTFSITIKKVGAVTDHIFRMNPRHQVEIPVVGLGGEFTMESTKEAHKETAFIAGGVGITPFLAKFGEMSEEEASRTSILWSVNAKDIGLVKGVLQSSDYPKLVERTTIFVTGNKEKAKAAAKEITALGVENVHARRLQEGDFAGSEGKAWYLCAAPTLRETVLPWIKEQVHYEDFGY